MPWLTLTVETDANHAEEVAEFLELFGASAVSFSAANDEKIFDQALKPTQTLWQATEVSGLLPHDVDMDILLVCLRERIGEDAIVKRTISTLDERDWIDDYQKSISLQWYGEKICICPSWLEPPKTKIAPIILDPGLAFGTGTHATTRLCLLWLQSQDLNNKVVIDYGCGSGILALAAVRLGAQHVYAIDIDPQAISATISNASQNDMSEFITASLIDEIKIPSSDVLVANVLLNPLLELAESLAKLIKAEGSIGLSGLLANQTDECLASYKQWFTMESPELDQEWALLKGIRKPSEQNLK